MRTPSIFTIKSWEKNTFKENHPIFGEITTNYITAELLPPKIIKEGFSVRATPRRVFVNISETSPIYDDILNMSKDSTPYGICGYVIQTLTRPYKTVDDSEIVYRQSPYFYNDITDDRFLFDDSGHIANIIRIFIFEGDNEEKEIQDVENWIKQQGLFIDPEE
jgi:hypothetical protein